MRTRILLATIASLGGCASQSVDDAQSARARSDSAQIIRSAWTAASEGHLRMRAAVLWAPSATDTGQFVAMSPDLQQLLLQAGVPLERRRTTGDDTVVLRLTGWVSDANGVVLEVRSAWTTVLRGGTARPCRKGSGNVERIRVLWRDDAWTAARNGPVFHGDQECKPIPPGTQAAVQR